MPAESLASPASLRWAETGTCLPFLGDAPAGELVLGLGRRRIDAKDGAPLLDLLLHEILEGGLLEGLVGHVVGDLGRDDGDALAVADDDVAWIDRHLAAADRHVEVDGVVL